MIGAFGLHKLEPLLARLQQVLDDPPSRFDAELIARLESDRMILQASMWSPSPHPCTIEAHVARVIDALREDHYGALLNW